MGLYGSAPSAPDPRKTADAQLNYELGSSQASGIINNPNTTDPYGTTRYNVSGYEKVTMPNGQTIQVPRYNQHTQLNARGQHHLNQQRTLSDQSFALCQRSVQPGLNRWRYSVPDELRCGQHSIWVQA